MAKFTMLVGLPASGKSTLAEKLKNDRENSVVLSSDALREEMFGDVNCQDRNAELFEEMNRRVKVFLNAGRDVIYDATNTNSKRRMGILSQLSRDTYKECIYMNERVMSCQFRDSERDRKVGWEVIGNMYRSLQIPMYHEGWDSIEIYPVYTPVGGKKEFPLLPKTYYEYEFLLVQIGCKKCIDLAQDTPYHTLSVSRHMFYAYDKIKDTDNEDVKIALLMHDIGKSYCKQFNGRYASFKGHDCVSAQMAVDILDRFGFETERIFKIATLIQLHMRMHNKEWGSKSRDKFKKQVGEHMWDDLVLVNNCDSSAK